MTDILDGTEHQRNQRAIDDNGRENVTDEPDVLMVSAVKYPWGEVVTGRRHRNVYKAMADKGIVSRVGCIEGFVGKSGRFYSREQAKGVAIESKQLSRYHEGLLNSEDLWPLTSAERATASG
ncbi:MAG TPA: hypothetical protein VIQ11_21005 [Mycobacterium sp.]